ncbi:MAG: hypothetical protein HYY54_09055 [candidate division NC10 bacterium]|nr:hypothetical protein [candidate division NC10 bacterium]
MRKARGAGRKKGKASAAKRPARKPARGAKGAKAAARKPAAKAAPRPAAAPAGGRVKELETELARWQTLPSQLQEQLRQRDSSISFKEKEILDLRKKVEEMAQAQKGKG